MKLSITSLRMTGEMADIDGYWICETSENVVDKNDDDESEKQNVTGKVLCAERSVIRI